MIRLLWILLGLWIGVPSTSLAWWNAEWTQRKKITFDTSETGIDLKEDVSDLVIPVRLHTGNFSFADAKENGADLRFVSADDKMPLKHHVEYIDGLNELAIIWVRIPKLAAASKANHIWMYYGNPKAAAGDDTKGSFDANQLATYHFSAMALHQDSTAYGHHANKAAGRASSTGFINGALSLDGDGAIELAASPSLRFPAEGGLTFAAWIKLSDAARASTLLSVGAGTATITLTLEQGRLLARLTAGGAKSQAGTQTPIAAGTWTHVAVTLGGGQLRLYVDGIEAGTSAAKSVELQGPVLLASNFAGEIDEVQLANAARAGSWIKATHAAQMPQSKLVGYVAAEAAAAEEGGASYFTILLNAVTLDGWIVIGILGVMAVISVVVMLGKGMLIARTSRANVAFRERFASMFDRIDAPAAADAQLGASSLYRVYSVGVSELQHRFAAYDAKGAARQLSPQALGAIKASIDAGIVRENDRLNSQMVLLTIAISGGPFLGLLGTVVGVMITFAAIAAVGDVNVNSIAPGIAAALVATVAGLGVAIPALFGYNYLASRIKGISNDTAVFADELVSRFAEKFAP